VVDHFQLSTQLARVGVTSVGLMKGSALQAILELQALSPNIATLVRLASMPQVMLWRL
jgi:hypothetical protein